MPILDMAEKPEKANIQGVEIHLVKMSNNGRKSDRANLGKKQMGGTAALLTEPEKVRADKRTIINVDRKSDASTVKKNMHECMTPDES